MRPPKELVDDLFRERVFRARRMSPEERLLAGPRLFDSACALMRDGIRDEYPDADDAKVERIFRQRLALHRKLEASARPHPTALGQRSALG